MPHSQEKREKEWSKELAVARKRVQAWRDSVAKSEWARKGAVDLLEACLQRMTQMQERGELGTRKNAEGEVFPQLRVVYWGEIESGTMNLACIEVDYGCGDKARVGIWGEFRAIWDSPGLGGAMERAQAWWWGRDMGSAAHAEAAWWRVKACLRVLSSDLELDLSFDEPEGALVLSSDEKQWSDWLSKEGSAIMPLGRLGLPAPEHQPSQQEWAELEIQAREALRMAKAQAQGSESDPSKPPSELGGESD